MSNPNENVGKNEDLKLENDFLKMKLMLEQGAQFGSMEGTEECPADVENQFLRNIIEFERQFAEHKTIRVFDKIGRPAHFKPVDEIPDAGIDKVWEELDEYLSRYSIDLAVLSPNVSKKELYRFTIEELFEYEMDDMDMPGMMHCFTYDEFHPDQEYENTKAAVEDCIKPMLDKELFQWMHHFRKEGLRLNDHFPLTEGEFKILVNLFHDAFEDLALEEVSDYYCSIHDTNCKVKGSYAVVGKLSGDQVLLKGNWLVEFEYDATFEYWYIVNVQVEGIEF